MAEQNNNNTPQRFVDRPFHGNMKIRFTNYIQERIVGAHDSPEFVSVEQVFRDYIEGDRTDELEGILKAFDHPLHGVVATGCSLTTVEWVYNYIPETVKDYDDEGLLPLHAALLYVRNEGDTFQWDVIRFLIEKHPGAIEIRECLSETACMVPIDAFLDRYHLEPTGSTMYDEHLSLFLLPGSELSLFVGYQHMRNSLYKDSLPTYVPRVFRDGHPVTCSFLMKQASYAAQHASYSLFLSEWVGWLLVGVREGVFGEASVAQQIVRDILLVRTPRGNNRVLLEFTLEYLCKVHNSPMAKIVEECLSGTPLSAVLDGSGCSPLHNLQPDRGAHEIVSFLVKLFPGILHHRNKAGLTAFQKLGLERFPREDIGDFDPKRPIIHRHACRDYDVLYKVLRADPVGTLTESFRPIDTMLFKSSPPLENYMQDTLLPPCKKRREP